MLELFSRLKSAALLLASHSPHRCYRSVRDGEKSMRALAAGRRLLATTKFVVKLMLRRAPLFWKLLRLPHVAGSVSALASWGVYLNLCLKFLKYLRGRVVRNAKLKSIFVFACWKSSEKIFYPSELFCFVVLLFAMWMLVVSTCICKSLFKGWLHWAESWQARSQP